MQGGAENFSHEWTNDTLTSLLAHRAAASPDALALIGQDYSISYGELATRVQRLASGFARLGITNGDVVSIQLPNVPEFLIAYLALSRLGAITSTIHMPYRARESADLMRAAHAKAFIGLPSWHDYRPAADVLDERKQITSLRHVIVLGEGGPPDALSWTEVAEGDTSVSMPPAPFAESPFLLLFTSGTSARPKGVRADYRRLLANARLNHTEMGIGRDAVMLSAAPYTHLLGLLTFHMTLYAGGTTLLLPEFAPDAFAQAIEAGRPTHVFVAPAHIAACSAQGLLEPPALDSVRYMVVSGASAPADLYRSLAAKLRNGSVAQVWGMTELQCGIFHRPQEPVERVATSCGRPAPAFEVRIADEEGRPMAVGSEGELQVRGVSVFDGYQENAEATGEAFTSDGWFRTGDVARTDTEGNVTITGRLKDLVNRGGIKINPIDVEEAITQMPAVQQCAIAPVPDPVLGERACAYVVLCSGMTVTLPEITTWLSELGIAKVKWPERLEILEELPMTPTRKVIKGRLRPADETPGTPVRTHAS